MDTHDEVDDSYIADWSDYLEQSKVRFNENWNKKQTPTACLQDFEKIKTIGKGAFGKVILMKHKNTNICYAVKILQKDQIKKKTQIQQALTEKRVLQSIKLPFAINLEFFFHDNSYLYFVLPCVSCGELFTHMKKFKKLDDSLIKFYAAQVLLALEYFHNVDLVYRDLKPENIFVEANGYLKLGDFGVCKIVKGRTYTLCGTPEYMAPEVILNRGYGKSADYWSFGILIYEMAAGVAPFQAREEGKIYDKILQGKYRNPIHFSNEIKDIIKKLLVKDTTKRLGAMKNGIEDIKDHNYFRNIPWLALINKKLEPPYVPIHKGEGDFTYFEYVPEENLVVASVDKFKNDFKDF